MSEPIKKNKWLNEIFQDDKASIERGAKFVSSGKVFDFSYYSGCCEGSVEASFASKTKDTNATKFHFVRFRFEGDTIINFSCDCFISEYQCSHVAALIIFASQSVSKTDVPVRISKVPPALFAKPVEEIVTKRKLAGKYSQLPPPSHLTEIYSRFYNDIKEVKVPLKRTLQVMLSPSVPVPVFPMAPLSRHFIEILLDVSKNGPMNEIISRMRTAMILNEQEINIIEAATRLQRNNPHWFSYRFGRITASKCHLFLNKSKANK